MFGFEVGDSEDQKKFNRHKPKGNEKVYIAHKRTYMHHWDQRRYHL